MPRDTGSTSMGQAFLLSKALKLKIDSSHSDYKAFKELKDYVRLQSKIYLDVEKTPRQQQPQLSKLIKKVYEKYPQYFNKNIPDIENRYTRLKQYIQGYHGQLRRLKLESRAGEGKGIDIGGSDKVNGDKENLNSEEPPCKPVPNIMDLVRDQGSRGSRASIPSSSPIDDVPANVGVLPSSSKHPTMPAHPAEKAGESSLGDPVFRSDKLLKVGFMATLGLGDTAKSRAEFEAIRSHLRNFLDTRLRPFPFDATTSQSKLIDAALQDLQMEWPNYFCKHVPGAVKRLRFAHAYLVEYYTYRASRPRGEQVEATTMIDKPSPSQCPPSMTPASERPSTSTVSLSANRITDNPLPAFGIDEDIRLFLASCNPPLVHLAGVFADMGCVTQQHLININHFASGDHLARYASLKAFFSGRGVKDAEIMAIQKQLDFAQ